MTRFWRGLLPAVPATPLREMVRAALGTGLGLLLADVILHGLAGSGPLIGHSLLIAPFGATAFLIFVVPNSPLAQPWSAVVGNTISALVGLAVLQTGLLAVPAVSLAVLLAVVAMAAARALHPPGAAVAIATVLAAPGPGFAIMPVFVGTLALVLCGIVWNHATGRHYPFRSPAMSSAQRQIPGPLALASAIASLRMGANLAVEDLARLIAGAEAASAGQNHNPLTAAEVMSRDLITLRATDDPSYAAALFRRHDFRHLPLLDTSGTYLGLIPQTALLGPFPDRRLADLADTSARTVHPATALASLLTLLAQGRQICIPVTEGAQLKGLITRSDLLVALTHGTTEKKDRT